MDKSNCRQYRSLDSRSDSSFYFLGTKIHREETPKGNRSTDDKKTRGWYGSGVRWMAHSTVDLVMPWFLGSICAPSPHAHRGRGGDSGVESFPYPTQRI